MRVKEGGQQNRLKGRNGATLAPLRGRIGRTIVHNEWPVVRVVGPEVLARAMEALLAEEGVPVSGKKAQVLLLLPPSTNGGPEDKQVKRREESRMGGVAVRMAGDLTDPEERRFCCPPGVVVRAIVSVEDPLICVLAALQAVAHNEVYCSPRLLPALLNLLHQSHSSYEGALPKPAGKEILSERETEVARAAAQGLSNEQIAQTLHVSVATVKFHLGRVFQKLHISRRSQIRATLPRPRERGPFPSTHLSFIHICH